MRLTKPVLSAAALIALAAACHKGGGPPAPKPEPAVAMKPLDEAARIYYDNGVAFADTSRTIVKDSVAFKAIWKRATQGQPSPPPLPVVDFSKDMVVVVAGGRMKPGDAIRVDSVGTRGTLMVIAVRTTVACQPFPTDAFPFEVVKVARTDGQVRFTEHKAKSPECQ
ncbi:MAG TPA: hypothetical protein VJN95_04830 [Gemmatimonadales bacterium]|nr:hypothetical protein [Gemmatimonadales bacterium]